MRKNPLAKQRRFEACLASSGSHKTEPDMTRYSQTRQRLELFEASATEGEFLRAHVTGGAGYNLAPLFVTSLLLAFERFVNRSLSDPLMRENCYF